MAVSKVRSGYGTVEIQSPRVMITQVSQSLEVGIGRRACPAGARWRRRRRPRACPRRPCARPPFPCLRCPRASAPASPPGLPVPLVINRARVNTIIFLIGCLYSITTPMSMHMPGCNLHRVAMTPQRAAGCWEHVLRIVSQRGAPDAVPLSASASANSSAAPCRSRSSSWPCTA